jgi:hypothetical protein
MEYIYEMKQERSIPFYDCCTTLHNAASHLVPFKNIWTMIGGINKESIILTTESIALLHKKQGQL